MHPLLVMRLHSTGEDRDGLLKRFDLLVSQFLSGLELRRLLGLQCGQFVDVRCVVSEHCFGAPLDLLIFVPGRIVFSLAVHLEVLGSTELLVCRLEVGLSKVIRVVCIGLVGLEFVLLVHELFQQLLQQVHHCLGMKLVGVAFRSRDVEVGVHVTRLLQKSIQSLLCLGGNELVTSQLRKDAVLSNVRRLLFQNLDCALKRAHRLRVILKGHLEGRALRLSEIGGILHLRFVCCHVLENLADDDGGICRILFGLGNVSGESVDGVLCFRNCGILLGLGALTELGETGKHNCLFMLLLTSLR
mmetsp:Transcript_34985/g.93344  ORF Transcript_34985/g.93344 Transcript_34985/m.93344 type:complete len:301 (-) Transcript_34985:173-1075(-)